MVRKRQSMGISPRQQAESLADYAMCQIFDISFAGAAHDLGLGAGAAMTCDDRRAFLIDVGYEVITSVVNAGAVATLSFGYAGPAGAVIADYFVSAFTVVAATAVADPPVVYSIRRANATGLAWNATSFPNGPQYCGAGHGVRIPPCSVLTCTHAPGGATAGEIRAWALVKFGDEGRDYR